jgi:hypothetical protein
MTPNIAICTLICAAVLMVVLTVVDATILSDHNRFLKDFVNQELLAILGVILAITLASAASLHLEFNKIEERFGRAGLGKAREGVKSAAYCLIGLFLASVVLVVTKPLFGDDAEKTLSLINGAALFILLWNVLLLIELTQAAFSIQPRLPPPREGE